MEENEKLKKLHESLAKESYDVPDYETFSNDLKDPSKSRTLYDALAKDNFQLPDYETFVSDLGLKKKDASDYGLPTKQVFADMFANIAKENLEVSRKPEDPITIKDFPAPALNLKTPKPSGYPTEPFANLFAQSMKRNIDDATFKEHAQERIAEIDKEVEGLKEFAPVLTTGSPYPTYATDTKSEGAKNRETLLAEKNQLQEAISDPTKAQYFFGKVYANTLVGMASKIYAEAMLGKNVPADQKNPHELNPEWLAKYDANTLTDVSATALGFILDAPAFSGFAVPGKAAGEAIAKPLVRKLMNTGVEKWVKAGVQRELAEKLVLGGAKKLAYTLPSVLSSGTALGGYGATIQALSDWSDPEKDFKDIDFGQVLSRGMKDFALGTGVGTLGMGTAAVAKKAQAIESATARGLTQAGVQAGGLTAESALFVGGGALLEGRKLKDITSEEFLETVALLGTLKASHIAQKPVESFKNIRQSMKFDSGKPGEGQFKVDVQPWELEALGLSEGQYKNVMDILSKDDAALSNILTSEAVPAYLKAKLLWGSRGVAMDKAGFTVDKVETEGEYVNLYNKKGVLIDKRKYDSTPEADQGAIELGLQLEDNKMQARSAEPDVDKVKIITDLKSKGTDIPGLLEAVDKPVAERTPEESKKVGDYYSMIPKPKEPEKGEEPLAIGDKTFVDKNELFKHLENVAVNKATGEIDLTWFDREIDAWPGVETVKAINEWTEGKKKEIKVRDEARTKEQEAKPEAPETPMETGVKKAPQKELDKNGLIDEIRKYNELSASQKKKNASQANTIRVNAKRMGYELKEDGEWKVGINKDGKFLALRKDPMKVDKAKIEKQKLLSEHDADFQTFVNDVLDQNPNLYGVMIGGLSNAQRAQAFKDIKAGKKSTASAVALSELERMYKTHGGIDVWNAEAGESIGISREEINKEKEALRKRIRKPIEESYDEKQALEAGLITKLEYDEITDYNKRADEQDRIAEEDFMDGETGDNKGIEEKGGGIERAREIEKIARDEGYEFVVNADLDPDMSSLDVYDSEKKSVDRENLPKGIKELADEYTLLIHDNKVSTDNIKDRFGLAKTTDAEILNSVPKTLIREENGVKIYDIDGTYVRDNIYTDYTMGGHELVYPEFIPKNEIWIDKDMNPADKEYTIKHEIFERSRMSEGLTYEKAHEEATKYEEKLRANEEPINKPNPPVSKGEESKLPGSTEDVSKPVKTEGKGKPEPRATPEQQVKIDAINKDYDARITDAQKELEGMTDEARNKVIRKAEEEVNRRNTIFGDADAIKDGVIKPEDQGFVVSNKPVEEATRKFDERKVELSKQMDALNKERESKIGEVLKQQEMKFEEPAKPQDKKVEGIPFKGKNYTDIEQVQDDFADGKLTLDEQKTLMEDVRKFEDKLKAESRDISNKIKDELDRDAGDMEKKIKDEINDENSKLSAKLFPDLIGFANDVLYRPLVKVRDKLADAIAGLMEKGVTSHMSGVRWSTKLITNLYDGLLRTEADMFGTGKEKQIGKLEMLGTVKTYAPHKAFDLLGEWRNMVNADPESLAKVWSALDPELATKAGEKPVQYGDLSLAEKDLFFMLKKWNTWVWSTNYANDLIPTESHLKFKGDYDATGYSNYIARMYDAYEENTFMAPEIQEFISRGNSAITKRMNTDYMKMREETNEWKQEHAIKDPAYLTAKRVMQTIQNVAIKQYMDMIIAEHPDYVKKLKKGEDVPPGYTKLGASYSWGPFRNKAVVNHVVEDFTGFYYSNVVTNTAYDAIKMFDRSKLNQFYKKYRTVYNPFVQTGNVTGNVFFASINGINPAEFIKGMVDSRNLHKKNPALYNTLLKSGLIGDVAMTGEMKPIDLLQGKKSLLGKADELATNMYTGADNLAKMSAYQIFRKRGFSHEEAVRRTYDAFQNYATVGKTWDVASKIPLIGPTFVKFQADLQRILTNSLLTTPLTTIGTVMLIKMLGNLTSALSGETEEEQAIRESRKGVAKIPFVNVPLSFKVGKSEVNVARYLSPLYMYNRGDSEMELSELSKFMPIQFQQKEEGNIFPAPAFSDATWGWVGSVITDKDFRGISIQDPHSTRYTNPNITTDERVFNVLDYVARSQIPFYKGAQDIYKGVTGQLDYYGRKRDWKQAILNNIIKIQEFDKPELKSYVERNIDYLTNRFAALSERMGDANNDFLKTVQNAKEQGLSDKVIQDIYEEQDKIRSKRLQKSLDEQVPVMEELERLTGVYKKWYPQDPFIQENFENLEKGKNRRFNIQDDIDLQKKYKDVYVLLKNNQLLERPVMPQKIQGKEVVLTEDLKKQYLNEYWSEYVRLLDARIGLTEEEIAEAKQKEISFKYWKSEISAEAKMRAERKLSQYMKKNK